MHSQVNLKTTPFVDVGKRTQSLLNYAVDDVDDDDVADDEAEEINREALEQDAAKVQTPASVKMSIIF